MRSQSATEYLIVFAVIMVIFLVVFALMENTRPSDCEIYQIRIHKNYDCNYTINETQWMNNSCLNYSTAKVFCLTQ